MSKAAREIMSYLEGEGSDNPKDEVSYTGLNKQKILEEKSREIQQEFANNIRISESYRRDISKGISREEDPTEILKMALKCIALMSGDNNFYKTNIGKLEK